MANTQKVVGQRSEFWMFNDGEFGVYDVYHLAWYHTFPFQKVYAYFFLMPDYNQNVSLFYVQQFEPLLDFLVPQSELVEEVGLVVVLVLEIPMN
jgi:hypothetical protein